MNLQHRIDLLVRLGQYILSADEKWEQVKENAGYENGWFTSSFTNIATNEIANSFLQQKTLEDWVKTYKIPSEHPSPKKVGIIMAGNIPLAGFHDFMCVFISGHIAVIKPSSKDSALIKHFAEKLEEWDASSGDVIQFADMLKGCDAYIATGSNNSSRYFEYYFQKYPHIIRRNRTSVAVLTGNETKEELNRLADDVHLYFGLGCRNVTKLYVPAGYDFEPLLRAFDKYKELSDHHKYKNNYDYNLALHLLNAKYYMTNGSVLLIEDPSIFSPISQLNYSFYENTDALEGELLSAQDLQCIVGKSFIPFGEAQHPAITDYADGIDTMRFLQDL